MDATTTRTGTGTATRGRRRGDEGGVAASTMRGERERQRKVAMSWQPLIGGACKVRPSNHETSRRQSQGCVKDRGGERSDSSIDSFHGWPGAPWQGVGVNAVGGIGKRKWPMCSASQINQGRRLMRQATCLALPCIHHLPDQITWKSPVRERKTLLGSSSPWSWGRLAGRYLYHSRACGASPGTREQQQITATACRFVSVPADAASQRLSGRRAVLADRLADDPNLCPPAGHVQYGVRTCQYSPRAGIQQYCDNRLAYCKRK